MVNKVEALSETELESASTLCATVWGTLYLRWQAPKVFQRSICIGAQPVILKLGALFFFFEEKCRQVLSVTD